jgi:hypothetical protein
VGTKRTKPLLLLYPRHDNSAGADDSAAYYVAEADEATIPVVDAAFAPPEGGDKNDQRAERLRAADAEAGRPVAERQLADKTRSQRERLASLSKRQWLGMGLATFEVLVIVWFGHVQQKDIHHHVAAAHHTRCIMAKWQYTEIVSCVPNSTWRHNFP